MPYVTKSTLMHNSLKRNPSETLAFVSVLNPVYNDSDAHRCCLHSLREQTYPADRFEVIVVDNGSTKDDPQAVLSEFPGYRFYIETKIGSYAARNKGISLAKGEVYAFIDSDCIASERWLEEGVRTLRHNPDCGLVGGQVEIFVKDTKHPTSVELYERVSGFRNKQYIEKLHACATCNMFVWA
jgi:glycosyltransferase involved in cell wall biosynthesis